MDHITADQLAQLRQALLRERSVLLDRAGHQRDDIPVDGAEPGDLQDKASEEAQRTYSQALSDHDRARLDAVIAALRRIDDGTYGTCEETGEPIPFARLKAEPTTRYTVEALEAIEDDDARQRVQAREPGSGVY